MLLHVALLQAVPKPIYFDYFIWLDESAVIFDTYRQTREDLAFIVQTDVQKLSRQQEYYSQVAPDE